MKMKMDMDALELLFGLAKFNEANYIAVMVSIDGTDGELIINPRKNFDGKLKYYMETYNKDLTHKHNPNIKITAVCYGATLSDIERYMRNHNL